MPQDNDDIQAPTNEQLQDFRNFASGCLNVPIELANQCINYVKDGNSFKPVYTEPLLSKIDKDQEDDLQLYFENL
jgi:hypothetical protein